MTKESHEKALYDAQHQTSRNNSGCGERLESLDLQEKKVTVLINKYQEKLSKSQENVTIMGEIYTIEASNVMSNDEVERLAKLEGSG
ncbi:hypothetical protein H5410_007650 [Solanum commersonii]|uniref:Uncharacterized protein n=1 Tax=Solanum commersonii TaxID=4109 RepID=A0A9J6AD12_SOLCO|nr:hypothetical protein H5410_007650 [Solanum commersonii]